MNIARYNAIFTPWQNLKLPTHPSIRAPLKNSTISPVQHVKSGGRSAMHRRTKKNGTVRGAVQKEYIRVQSKTALRLFL